MVRFIFRECAQALKELYIHDDSDWWEEYIFDDFSCFNLEKLVFVASSNIHDRFFEVLDLDNPEIRDLPAPRLRSLSIRGLDAQHQQNSPAAVGVCGAVVIAQHPVPQAYPPWPQHGHSKPATPHSATETHLNITITVAPVAP